MQLCYRWVVLSGTVAKKYEYVQFTSGQMATARESAGSYSPVSLASHVRLEVQRKSYSSFSLSLSVYSGHGHTRTFALIVKPGDLWTSPTKYRIEFQFLWPYCLSLVSLKSNLKENGSYRVTETSSSFEGTQWMSSSTSEDKNNIFWIFLVQRHFIPVELHYYFAS
jgi:hypothetical protein